MNIDIDTSAVRQNASKISTESQDYQNHVKTVYSKINELPGGWVGEDASAYIAKVESCKADIEALGQVIQEYSEYLNKVANNYDEYVASVKSSIG